RAVQISVVPVDVAGDDHPAAACSARTASATVTAVTAVTAVRPHAHRAEAIGACSPGSAVAPVATRGPEGGAIGDERAVDDRRRSPAATASPAAAGETDQPVGTVAAEDGEPVAAARLIENEGRPRGDHQPGAPRATDHAGVRAGHRDAPAIKG